MQPFSDRSHGTRPRVVITGIGSITALGCGGDALWQGMVRGASGVGRITHFDPTPFRTQIAAEVRDFDPLDHFEQRRARRLSRFVQFAVATSRLALEDAALQLEREDAERVAVYLGSTLGGTAFAEEQHSRFVARGLGVVEPGLALAFFGGAAAMSVAVELGTCGPALGNANSCASGAIAIGDAFRLLQAGAADVALAGGAEAPFAPLTFGAFAVIKAMSTRNDDPGTACRPFDAARDGFVMGEGAAVLTLETLPHALARDAHIYAEVLGYGATNDAYHMVAPRPGGEQAARAMRLAVADAGLRAADVGYVNAHGSSTPLGDHAEALAIQQALGDAADRVPVSGTKPLYGHPLGASGAVEAAVTALALHHGFLPPTINLSTPDPDSALDHVMAPGRWVRPSYALTNSFGFGGINACLAIGAWSE
jgi:3-oxoacyl-[acyl-carrier-protein] synthase II